MKKLYKIKSFSYKKCLNIFINFVMQKQTLFRKHINNFFSVSPLGTAFFGANCAKRDRLKKWIWQDEATEKVTISKNANPLLYKKQISFNI